LARLLTATFGPHTVLADEFAVVGGVDRVLIYGSWAARYHGNVGPPSNDVDVLVTLSVRRPDRGAAYEAVNAPAAGGPGAQCGRCL